MKHIRVSKLPVVDRAHKNVAGFFFIPSDAKDFSFAFRLEVWRIALFFSSLSECVGGWMLSIFFGSMNF